MDFGGFGLRAQVNCLVKFQPWGCYVFEPLRLYEERAATKSKKDELQDQLSVQKLEQWSCQLCNTRSSWISALYAHLVLQLYIQYSAVCCPIWTMFLVMLRVILQYAHTSRFSQGSFSQCYLSANRPLSWHSSSASDGACRQPAETFKRTQKTMRETRLIPL